MCNKCNYCWQKMELVSQIFPSHFLSLLLSLYLFSLFPSSCILHSNQNPFLAHTLLVLLFPLSINDFNNKFRNFFLWRGENLLLRRGEKKRKILRIELGRISSRKKKRLTNKYLNQIIKINVFRLNSLGKQKKRKSKNILYRYICIYIYSINIWYR